MISIVKKIFGTANERMLKKLRPKVAEINALEPELQALSDEGLRAKADGIMAELAAGADFGDIARKYSQDSRKGKGGDWGWQRRSDLRKEFSDVIFTLKKGERSEPLVTAEGTFLFFGEDRKYSGTLPIDEVRPEIEKALVQQGSRKATERWLEKLRRNAYVKHF